MVFDSSMPDIDDSKMNMDANKKTFYGNVKETDPKHMLESIGKPIMISSWVDANHAENVVTTRSYKNILIYMNNALIVVFSKNRTKSNQALLDLNISRDLFVA